MLNRLSLVVVLAYPMLAISADFKTQSRNYSIVLGATRIVFSSGKSSYDLPVENQQDYPVLVETKIMDENSEARSSSYLATPPLFRLDGGEKNTVSIIKMREPLAKNIETLNWVCVKSIPPTKGSAWIGKNDNKNNVGSINVDVMVKNCIKIISRPAELDDLKDGSYGSKLKWNIKNGKLIVDNPTPYYINFGEIVINGNSVTPPIFIKPQGYYSFDDKSLSKTGSIKWRLIDDYGALTKEFSTMI
ncbi:TPA: molecular chaperone [Escherichia coli]|jgi:P pilus assembly chaperone PapD|uniref:fimbrial biogenesis chaperone n=1 Tax=Escherichia coli TaxID=562 RepID=UPI000415C9A6|nr:molecular chaperone [Escherichia coli]EFN8605142.1 molecular chaperone [Escherichia coli O153:H12]EJN7857742.1 molecular chaperone [Salmonella enterica subsp. enterica serovar Infantis]EFH8216090.1 molecular chaperone [Escherichia coli]EFO0899814.1 molecular chaperone [Escherichia coli]EFO1530542.1 molecular chaperone [Escherichia coli]